MALVITISGASYEAVNGQYKLTGTRNGHPLYKKNGDFKRYICWNTQAKAWIIDQEGPAPYRLTFVNDCILKRYGTNFPILGGVWEPYQPLDDIQTMMPPPFTLSIYNDPAIFSTFAIETYEYKPITAWHCGMSFIAPPHSGKNDSSLLSAKQDAIYTLGTVCRMYRNMLTQPNKGIQKMIHHDILKPILDLMFNSTSTTVRIAASKTASKLVVLVPPR